LSENEVKMETENQRLRAGLLETWNISVHFVYGLYECNHQRSGIIAIFM